MKSYISLLVFSIVLTVFCGCEDLFGEEESTEMEIVDESDIYTIIVDNKQIIISDDSITRNWATFAKVTNTFTEIEVGASVIEYGHVWSSSTQEPNIFNADGRSQLGITLEEGPFESLLKDLEPLTTYHVRAYFVPNSGNPKYSDVVSTFTTKEQGLVNKATYPGVSPSFSASAEKNVIVGHENNIWQYNPRSDNWTKLVNVPSQFDGNAVTAESIGELCYFAVKMSPQSSLIFSYDSATNEWRELTTGSITFTHKLNNEIHGVYGLNLGCTISHQSAVRIDPFQWTTYSINTNSVGTCDPCYCYRLGNEEQGEFVSNYTGSDYMNSEYILKYRCGDSQNILYKNDVPFANYYCGTGFGGRHYYISTTITSIFDELYILGGMLGNEVLGSDPCELDEASGAFCTGQILTLDLNTPFSDFNVINNGNIGGVQAVAVVDDVIFCGLGDENGGFTNQWYELVP